VTNYSYGDAGGFTQPRYTKEGIISKESYKDGVMTLLGGRAAEEVLLHQISTGASEDFARALKQIKAYYEVYHFVAYEVEKLNQLAEDTLREWYNECVEDFNRPHHKDRLTRLANAIISERVLYTKDIASILTI
jgi:ATP-dependent Zn protease